MDRERRRAFAIGAAIVAIGLALRVLYALLAQVEHPVRGDIVSYVSYAWNLVHQGVYSGALPQSETFPPDSYRGPGYPLLLAAAMLFDDRDLGWIPIAIGFQIVLGTATIALTMLYARTWLPRPAVYAAGLLVALWPHLITFCSTLLAETLFGFCVLLALYLSVLAERRNSRTYAILAGLVFGYGYLVNPLVMLFPPVLAGLLALRRRWRIALPLLAAFLLLPGIWAARNAGIQGGGASQRMVENLVQGSWPLFLPAFNARGQDEIAAAIVAAVQDEQDLARKDPRAAFTAIAERMAEDPAAYAQWYLATKPWNLWDWSIVIGAGDIYFHDTTRSPFVNVPLLRGLAGTLRALNPLIFALAALAAFGTLLAWLWRRAVPLPALLVALFALYATAVHAALQAEPRFAVSYRPEELLLAVYAVAAVAASLRRRFARQGEGAQSGEAVVAREAEFRAAQRA